MVDQVSSWPLRCFRVIYHMFIFVLQICISMEPRRVRVPGETPKGFRAAGCGIRVSEAVACAGGSCEVGLEIAAQYITAVNQWIVCLRWSVKNRDFGDNQRCNEAVGERFGPSVN